MVFCFVLRYQVEKEEEEDLVQERLEKGGEYDQNMSEVTKELIKMHLKGTKESMS